MALNPADRNGFSMSCPGSSTVPAVNASVVVTVYFGFDQNTTFPFGKNKTVSVPKGGLKFNVEYSNWPFCNDNNILGMEIDLLLKGDEAAQANVSTASDGSQVLTVPLSNDTTTSIYFANYAYEAKNGTRNMSVGVSLATSGGKSTVTLKLPNPSPNATVYYDPTVTVTTTSPGGAAGIRAAMWSAVLAVLLGAFLRA
ncbi:hypothetical protein PLESTM_001358000 [Pleodorina starrii]|nr:hypothetical protein PLESTM_001358000 [Pleodorina starrii]